MKKRPAPQRHRPLFYSLFFLYPHHIRGDFSQRMRTAHLHGVGQLTGQLINVALHAFLAAAIHSRDERAADQHAVCTQCQCFEHIHTGADAAVHQDLHAGALEGCCDLRQHLGSGRALIQHAAAVVGHHDSSRTGFLCLQCAFNGHNALDDEGALGQLDDLGKLCHALAACGRSHVLQEGQTGCVHIHGHGKAAAGLVLDYSLENNMVLQRYWQPEFQKGGFIRSDKVREYSDKLIAQYDVRSGQGSLTTVRSMSGGNQQKAIIAREIDKDPKLLVAVQPTRGLDVGAIEYIHRQIVAERDKGTAVLLVSLELDEVMNLSDRILVMYEGEVVGEFDPKTTTVQELGLYMAGARKQGKESK